MRALLVIDVQNVLVEKVDFRHEKERIKKLIREFKQNEEPVIFIRHTDAEGPMAAGSKGRKLIQILWNTPIIQLKNIQRAHFIRLI